MVSVSVKSLPTQRLLLNKTNWLLPRQLALRANWMYVAGAVFPGYVIKIENIDSCMESVF